MIIYYYKYNLKINAEKGNIHNIYGMADKDLKCS